MAITVRKINTQPDATTPQHWFAGCAFETHFFNALSSTFPEGERFFIQSVRRYTGAVTDPALAAQVASFSAQEGQHSREHDHHMTLLTAQGYTWLNNLNNLARNVLRWFVRHLPRFSLALTTAIEHVTAIVAHQLLSRPELWLDRMSPDMRLLWHWHAVEEAEHKSVAFDVYQASGGGYTLRLMAMGQVMFGFMLEIFVRHTYMLAKDGALFDLNGWRRGITFLWGKNGFIRRVARHFWAFGKADFHPWQHDNSALIEPFVARYADAFTELPQDTAKPSSASAAG